MKSDIRYEIPPAFYVRLKKYLIELYLLQRQRWPPALRIGGQDNDKPKLKTL